MSESTVACRKRSIAIFSGVAVLLLTAVGCKEPKPSPDEIVNVIQEKIDLPPEFAKKFSDLGVKGLILVSEIKQGGTTTIRVVKPDGTPIDLCNPGAQPDKGKDSCQLASSEHLLSFVTAANTCGRCNAGGFLWWCHKDTGKFPCHNSLFHHTCSCS